MSETRTNPSYEHDQSNLRKWMLVAVAAMVLFLSFQAYSQQYTADYPTMPFTAFWGVNDNPWKEVQGHKIFGAQKAFWFDGLVITNTDDGIVVSGWYGHFTSVRTLTGYQNRITGWLYYSYSSDFNGEFIITNYNAGSPIWNVISDPDWNRFDHPITLRGIAFLVPSINDTSLSPPEKTPVLDCGRLCAPPPPPAPDPFTAKLAAIKHDASNGDSRAQVSLAICYRDGLGCKTNLDTAAYWFKKAADQGSIEASNDLVELQDCRTNWTTTATNSTAF